jgi:hypothetical protein
MRRLTTLALASILAATVVGAAQADILITVDKSAQRMTVTRDGEMLYRWPVSTGRNGYATPSGSFTAFRMEEDHYSKEWDEAPMPYSIFFTKLGHAIHGSYETRKLGTPASHGCVRLSPAHAATLFAMVQRDGVSNAKVVLTGGEEISARRRMRSGEDTATVRPNDAGTDAGVQYVQPSDWQRFYAQPGYDPTLR